MSEIVPSKTNQSWAWVSQIEDSKRKKKSKFFSFFTVILTYCFCLLQVVTHEICHVMGLSHCQYFACTMNKSPSILYTDMQPLFLCPICLRKVQIFLDFSLKDRYQAIKTYLRAHSKICQSIGITASNMSLSLSEESCRFRSDLLLMEKIISFILRSLQ